MKESFLRKLLCILYLFLFLLFPSKAQTGKFYSTNNELSSSLINQIFQDSRGFIWVATEYGLNRFDGFRFVDYMHVTGNASSIKDNYVRTVFEDSKQNLLVGCINGLMKYDRSTDSFHEVPMLRKGKQVFPHVVQMCELHNNEIWIVTAGQGLFKLIGDFDKAQSVDEIMQKGNYLFLRNIYEDAQRNIWIGTEGNGILCYTPANKKVMTFKTPAINDNNISSIIEDKNGNLFVGTQKHGISRYDRQTKSFIPVSYSGNESFIVYSLSLVNGKILI